MISSIDPKTRLIFRGTLILLVILGHNYWVHDKAYEFYKWLYSFHVGSFLALSAFTQARLRKIPEKALSYLWPYVVFSAVYGITFYLLLSPDRSADAQLIGLSCAILSGNAETLDEFAGFEMLWFMPAFFTLYVANAAFASLHSIGKLLALLGFALVHLFAGTIPADIKASLPFGIGIVGYMFLLISLFRYLAEIRVPLLIPILLFLASSILFIISDTTAILSDLEVPSWREPLQLFSADALFLSAAVSILGICRIFAKNSRGMTKPLEWFGAQSLMIYFLHPPLIFIGYAAIEKAGLNQDEILALLITFAFSAMGGLLLSLVIDRSPIRHLLQAKSRRQRPTSSN
tara:strand:- start:33733 stop:34770 length:1038 start_codon:yes stop_codon:yes gene_type:complete